MNLNFKVKYKIAHCTNAISVIVTVLLQGPW